MSFAQFTEEQPAIQLLQRSLDRGRVSHSYLFSGSTIGELEGVARTAAKALNCQRPPKIGSSGLAVDSCDQCPSCLRIDQHAHPDVYWVRPESKSRVITIEQMRELMKAIYLKPSEAAYKVAMIVSAERLNIQAGNAFLKTLEEPPPKSIVVLLSSEPQRVLETLVSRCLRLNFPGEGHLRLEREHGAWLAEFGEIAAQDKRGLLPRYRLLSKLLARLEKIREETEQFLTSRSPLEKYDDIEPKLKEKWEEELTAAIEAEYRRQRGDVLLALEWLLRDIWLQSIGHEVMAFPALAEMTRKIGQRLAPAEAMGNLNNMERAQQILASNVQEALALEVSFLRLKL